MTAFTTTEAVDEHEMDISHQENVSRRAGNRARSSKQQVRHRASIACFSCRDRRIRCVVPKGGSGCIQCKRSGAECVIKNDDERRRPISKAYVSSLSARIALLESMLKKNGIAVPPAIHPPMTKHEAQSTTSGDDHQNSAIEARPPSESDARTPNCHVLSPPYSQDDFAMYESPIEDLANTDSTPEEPTQNDSSPLKTLSLDGKDHLHQMLAPNGGLWHDRLSGAIQFLGPTANCHVYAECPKTDYSRESPEQTRRAERIIGSLAPKTHDSLMQNFWNYHNEVLRVVDKAAFEADRGCENPKFYSPFLHVIILALGWRFADKDNCDIARLNLGNHESTLHREARYMLGAELDKPMRISSVQALLLLGDLECGVGRDNAGWMYAGMASHLALGLGLHVSSESFGLSENEINIRGRVMKATLIYDRHWALLLGRPTFIKSQDVDPNTSRTTNSKTCPSKASSSVPKPTQTIDDEIYEQLARLMNIAGQLVESRSKTGANYDAAPDGCSRSENEEVTIGSIGELILDQNLRDWYERLPSHLAWNSDNISTAPCSYFLLHEQYHSALTLLHRSRELHSPSSDEMIIKTPSSPEDLSSVTEASVEDQGAASDESTSPDAVESSKTARNICTEAAIQLAQIFSQHKTHYDLEKTSCIGLQPAGTAAMALIAAIIHSDDELERKRYLASLETVSDAIHVMSRSYQPARRMENLIQSLLSQLQGKTNDSQNGSGDFTMKTSSDGETDAEYHLKAADSITVSLAQQEHCDDRDQNLQNDERPHFTPTQNIPRSTRPAPSFTIPPNPLHHHQNHLNHQANTMSSLMSGYMDVPDTPMYLDSFYNPAIGVGNMYNSRYHSDTYLRVAPSAKGWGLLGLHVAIPAQQSTSGFDSPMPDWTGAHAHANFGTSSTLYRAGQSTPRSSSFGSETHTHIPAFKRENTTGLVWVNSDSGLGVNEGARPADPPRNHELDYLTL
ncbi:fungal-specific transcription factor domain-containing protein [Astrocystis sublimbata]|nr:fungal-specific transcription factor domain-containing protein [Astrocystis sublimbata]